MGCPAKAPYGHDEISKQRMLEERDLGRFMVFNGDILMRLTKIMIQIIQVRNRSIKKIVETLKTNPRDRRMIVNSGTSQLAEMGLPPCHYSFQVTTIGNKLI